MEACRERLAALTVRYDAEEAARRLNEEQETIVAQRLAAERDGRWAAIRLRPRSEQLQFIVAEAAPSLVQLGIGLFFGPQHAAGR